jgi:cysteine desulfuration protein SufE
MPKMPPRLSEIIEDFELCEGREKIDLLVEYSDKLPALPEQFKEQSLRNRVEECMTQADGGLRFHFDIPPESPTVRGFAAILEEGLRGAAPEDVLAVPGDFFMQMGLHEVLTMQRLNGIAAMLAYIKRLAAEVLVS